MEEALEWSWARTEEEIAAVKFVLSKFFTMDGDIYAQQRVQDEIDAYHAKSLKNQEIALAREASRRALRERNEHETCTDHHLTTNHKPLTTNQEEIKSSCDQQAESPKGKRIPFAEIFDAYAERLNGLPQLRIIDDSRKAMIRSRWNADERFQSVDFWDRFFTHVSESDFLMGRTDRPWTGCCFDWLLKPANFRKIVEGNYTNA